MYKKYKAEVERLRRSQTDMPAANGRPSKEQGYNITSRGKTVHHDNKGKVDRRDSSGTPRVPTPRPTTPSTPRHNQYGYARNRTPTPIMSESDENRSRKSSAKSQGKRSPPGSGKQKSPPGSGKVNSAGSGRKRGVMSPETGKAQQNDQERVSGSSSPKDRESRADTVSESNVKIDVFDEEDQVNEQTKETAQKSWQTIEEQCVKLDEDAEERLSDDGHATTGWRTIRLFVSSTFTDFHSEREILVKKVFPALREWCEERKLHLIDCDLRWGVPKDSTSGTTIATCLEELDRCQEETEGEAFFLNMLGNRYGWVPDLNEVPEDIQERYNWVPDLSMTHMEILHGAYRGKNANALFFMREGSFQDDLPEDQVAKFQDQDELSRHQLRVLKQKLTERFPFQVFNYTCQVGKTDDSTGTEKVVLEGLDDFASRVLDFYKQVIDRKYPEQPGILQPSQQDEQEDEVHRQVLESLAQFVCGRDKELELLTQFATAGTVDDSMKELETGDDDQERLQDNRQKALSVHELQESDNAIVCVTGSPGIGKSALLAKLAKDAMQDGIGVFYHNVGCSPPSLIPAVATHRLIRSLSDDPNSAEVEALKEATFDETRQRLSKLLNDYRDRDTELLIVIDGLDEMSDNKASHHLSWLPARFPGNLRCVVGCSSQEKASLSRLVDRQARCLELAPLEETSREAIVENYFNKYNKKLDGEQMKSLISHEGATAPLWLRTACEELRVFGDFRTLTQKIASLPDDQQGMFTEVIARLLKEDETECMEKLLSLIYCSRGGLPESEVRSLLGDQETKQDATMLTWATLRRYLKPFMRTSLYWYNGSLRIQFFHDSMKQAVYKQLFEKEDKSQTYQQLLADYYQYTSTDLAYVIEDLPYHLYTAGLQDRLVEFYASDKRAFKSPLYVKRQYLNEEEGQGESQVEGQVAE